MRCLLLVLGLLLCSGFVVAEPEKQKEEKFTYDDKGKRDPLLPLVSSTGTFINVEQEYILSDLTLEGIVTGNTGNIAIINGQVVNEKQQIGDFVVEEIGQDFVILLKGTQKSTLRLTKED